MSQTTENSVAITWILEPSGDDEFHIKAADGVCLAHVRGNDANARLIAAAPEMYEALKGWLPIVERQLEQLPVDGRDSAAYAFARERVDKTRAAIAKAECR